MRRWGRLLGWGWLCGRGGLWSRSPTGLRTGHYMGSLIRGRFGFGGGREAVVAVAVDGGADGIAPGVGAESVDVFVLGEVDGLHESLRQVGDGMGGFGFYLAADNGGDEASQGGAEIAGGEVFAGEEVGQVPSFCLARAWASFSAWSKQKWDCLPSRGERQRRPSENVNEHKDTRSLALRDAIKVSLELSFGICCTEKSRQGCRRYEHGLKTRNAPTGSGRSSQRGYCTIAVMRVKLKIGGKSQRSQNPQP